MAMFSATKRDADLPAALRSSGHEPKLSILAAGIKVIGEIQTEGVVKIEGEVEGSVRADGQVLVSRGGIVKGDIATRQAIIAGEVHGGIYADERVELHASSQIDGDITAPRIVVEEGGQVNGNIRMANPQAVKQRHDRNAKEGSKPGSTPTFELAVAKGPNNEKVAASQPN